jgi:hypothetical protein
VVGAVSLAGCSGGPSSAPRAASPSASTPSTTAASAGEPGAPSPGSLAKPATTSGALSKTSFPRPRDLGAGWTYAVDPGSAEEGYAGNGTPALARNPQEVVETAVPLGCARHSAMPVPQHALEVDYTYRGTKAIAVSGLFADTTTATAFFNARATNLRGCLGVIGSPAIGPLVTDVSSPNPQVITSARTPRSDPWQEVGVLDGDTVVLLAVQGPSLSPSQTHHLVTELRR